MINANLTLKGSFFKKKYSDDAEVPAIVQLNDGSSFELHFLIYRRVILVENIEGNQYKLTQERRMAIIDAVLMEYTTILKSIIHCSISYEIQLYKMVDNTSSVVNLDDKSIKNVILQEYLEDERSNVSLDIVLRSLKSIYDKLKLNYNDINKADVIEGSIDYKLNFIQKKCLNYYLRYILDHSFNIFKFEVNIDANTNKFIITIEKN